MSRFVIAKVIGVAIAMEKHAITYNALQRRNFGTLKMEK